jgi:hypothetical protein
MVPPRRFPAPIAGLTIRMSSSTGPAAITIFATPKAFRGHFAVIQRNAVASWTKLGPTVDVILMGDDAGTAELARELGIRHIGGIASFPSGAPRLDDVFDKAEDAVSGGLLCYVNADIMLTGGVLKAAERVAGVSPIMVTGRRWNVDITEPWDFSADWQQRLERLVRERGEECGAAFVDYFLFSRGLGRNILPLALGRTLWDNWLITNAHDRGARLFDATRLVVAAHQNHDYSHHATDPKKGVWSGEEAAENKRLIGRSRRLLTLDDIAQRLTSDGIERSYRPLWRTISFGWRHPGRFARSLRRHRAGG